MSKIALHERLLTTFAPINRIAARVVKPAKPEDVWIPKLNKAQHIAFSDTVLPVAPFPEKSKKLPGYLYDPIGKRRGFLTVVGFAKNQPNCRGAWVVRCGCGNYEHRNRIFRWLGTDAPDCCRECWVKNRIAGEDIFSREPAIRETVEIKKVKK